ncbi:MAG: aminoacyl-tRNA hydrolase [Patescibacteria group bacterium]|jgi:PTH1 family peptidyl-tRNA hydrolase
MTPLPPFLIVGLGNPSPKYDGTRHNVGRAAVDAFLQNHTDTHELSVPHFSGHAYKVSLLAIRDLPFAIAVSDLGTYMNTSGPMLERVRSFFNIPHEKVVVVHDDLDLPFDKMRISIDASAGGHNGVTSVIAALGTKNFLRLRIGIESRTNKEQSPADAFVLQKFSESETKDLSKILTTTTEALQSLIANGLEKTMNVYN